MARLLPMAACLVLGMSLLGADLGLAQPSERIEADVSAREIAIESTFTGVQIIVFGAVENSRQGERRTDFYDIAVIIRGPQQDIVTRRKERIAGIWVNTHAQSFTAVPGYYAVLTTGPVAELADEALLKKHGIGLGSLDFLREDPTKPTNVDEEAFRQAIVRIKRHDGLYVVNEETVRFIGSSLFRASVRLPANVPAGEYTADIFLFRKGSLLSHHTGHFVLHKQGFERYVNTLAFDYPLLYGVIAVLVAVASGLIASAMFRRD